MFVVPRIGLLALCTLLAACRFGDFSPDAGPDDAAPPDALVVDAFVADARPSDGGLEDASLLDAAPADAEVADAAVADAEVADADLADADVADADLPDAEVLDAGPHPMGPLGAGLSTLVGHGEPGLLDGPRDFALLFNPVNVKVGADGNIYVADFGNSAIRRVTPAGDTTTLTRQAGFSRPFGMLFTSAGDLFVQTDHNSAGVLTGAIWRVALDTGIATIEIENIGRVRGMAELSDGRFVLADVLANTLRIYDPADQSIADLAGSAGLAGFVDGTGSAARFNRPLHVVVNSSDAIFVSDAANNRIRLVTLAGVVTTLAGNGTAASVDGPALSSSINRPQGLALSGDNTLYICEFETGLVRELSGGNLSTIAGLGQGFADNVDPLLGRIQICEGIDFASNFLYISDGNGGTNDLFHRVRRLDLTP